MPIPDQIEDEIDESEIVAMRIALRRRKLILVVSAVLGCIMLVGVVAWKFALPAIRKSRGKSLMEKAETAFEAKDWDEAVKAADRKSVV